MENNMKLTKSTLLIATTLLMASTTSLAAKNKTLIHFKQADKNKDSQVTLVEMTQRYEVIFENNPNAKSVKRAIKLLGENATTQKAKVWIKRNDKNGDGIVTLDEIPA